MIVYAQHKNPFTQQCDTLVFRTLTEATDFFGVLHDYDSIQKKLKRKKYCHIYSSPYVSLPIGYTGTWLLTKEGE